MGDVNLEKGKEASVRQLRMFDPARGTLTYTSGGQVMSLRSGKFRSHLVTLRPGQADAAVGTWPFGEFGR